MWVEHCESTNDLARRAGPTATHGDWIAARTQTQGRGRQGHSWESLAGNLHVSFILKLPANRALWSWNPLITGLAVALAVEKEFPEVAIRLKWPNDLYFQHKKLGGILCEAESGVHAFWVAGIGLNLVAPPPLPEAIALNSALKTAALSAEGMLPKIREELLKQVARLDEGGAADLSREYLERAELPPGESITWQERGQTKSGRVAGLGAHGQLLVVLPEGQIQHLYSEDVRSARKAGGESLP